MKTDGNEPSSVRIFEVGLRDGLQNEKKILPLNKKVWLARSLVKAGVRDLELGAFVRADRVPQMADTDLFYDLIRKRELKLHPARTWALVANAKGFQRAAQGGAYRIALFTAATESFVKKNIGMTIAGSLKEFKEVIRLAKAEFGEKLEVRGYVSTAFGCPFEGKVQPKQALRVVHRLAELGVSQVSIGDTIGVATPGGVDAIVRPALAELGADRVAVHFHDTRGTALANTLRSLEYGVTTVDSSVAGLGGCPFAPGAAGNLATEDLVYMLNGMNIRTGIDLKELCKVGLALSKVMNRPLTSRYLQAYAHRTSSVF